jgi:hypothetical protein
VKDPPTKSFTGVARALGSGTLMTPTHMVDLWAMLPEAGTRPAPGDGSRWAPLQLELATEISEYVPMRILSVWTHGWPADRLAEWEREGIALNDRVIESLVLRYPTMHRPYVGENVTSPMQTDWFEGGRGSVLLNLPISGAQGDESPADALDQRWFYDLLGQRYRGNPFWFPAVAGDAMHPLIAWWAVLYALSMLARYEPQRWATLIHVDTSAWATPLEHLLDVALEGLPEIIRDALTVPPDHHGRIRLAGPGDLVV